MKQSIQLKFGQHLTMTPQLQQAIRLLQLSSLDLQQEIQEALDSNPLLESDEPQDDFESLDDFQENKKQKEELNNKEQDSQDDYSVPDSHDEMTSQEIPDQLPTDSTWDDHFTQGTSSGSSSSSYSADDDTVYQGETIDSIRDHLLWQMDLTPFSPLDRGIAIAIIDAIDDSGYLTVSAQDILDSLGDEEVELDEVEAVLKRIQVFDPIGVASRTTQECLLVQLNQFSTDTPWLNEAKLVIKNYIDLLGNRD